MAIRRILVPFTGQAGEVRALRAALTLAKIHKAHVETWHIQPDPLDIITTGSFYIAPMDCYPPDSTIADLRKASARKCRTVEKFFIKVTQKMGVQRRQGETHVPYATASFHTSIGRSSTILAERGRVSDLIVMARLDGQPEYSATRMSALFNTGRPLLLVPSRKSAPMFNGKTLIAWDGSKEAASAVGLAMPILEQDDVWIITANEKDGTQAEYLEPRDIISYLREHDVRVQGKARKIRGRPLPEKVLKAAHELDAGLIIMGAYSHSRAREAVFGGMTDFMLKQADIPVLFSH